MKRMCGFRKQQLIRHVLIMKYQNTTPLLDIMKRVMPFPTILDMLLLLLLLVGGNQENVRRRYHGILMLRRGMLQLSSFIKTATGKSPH